MDNSEQWIISLFSNLKVNNLERGQKAFKRKLLVYDLAWQKELKYWACLLTDLFDIKWLLVNGKPQVAASDQKRLFANFGTVTRVRTNESIWTENFLLNRACFVKNGITVERSLSNYWKVLYFESGMLIDTVNNLVFWSRFANKLEPRRNVYII